MAALTFAQLEDLWTRNGGNPALAPTMAAIALAESGGNPDSLNPNDNNGTQSSFGLWQISTGTHTPPDPKWADPDTNAALAVGKYKTQGLRAWGTYTNGAYLPYLKAHGDIYAKTGGEEYAGGEPLNPCLIKTPGNLPCLLNLSQARAVIGGMALAGGGLIMLSGLVLILVAVGIDNKAIRAAAQATGAGRVATAVRQQSPQRTRRVEARERTIRTRISEEGKLQRQQERQAAARMPGGPRSVAANEEFEPFEDAAA